MSDDFIDPSDLLKEVAKVNQTALTPEDPIMVVVTFLNVLAGKIVPKQEEIMENYGEKLEELFLVTRQHLGTLTQTWEKNAESVSNRILNASLEGGKSTLYESSTQLSEKISEILNTKIAAFRAENNKAQKTTRTMVVCSIMSLVGGITAFFVAILLVLGRN